MAELVHDQIVFRTGITAATFQLEIQPFFFEPFLNPSGGRRWMNQNQTKNPGRVHHLQPSKFSK